MTYPLNDQISVVICGFLKPRGGTIFFPKCVLIWTKKIRTNVKISFWCTYLCIFKRMSLSPLGFWAPQLTIIISYIFYLKHTVVSITSQQWANPPPLPKIWNPFPSHEWKRRNDLNKENKCLLPEVNLSFSPQLPHPPHSAPTVVILIIFYDNSSRISYFLAAFHFIKTSHFCRKFGRENESLSQFPDGRFSEAADSPFFHHLPSRFSPGIRA